MSTSTTSPMPTLPASSVVPVAGYRGVDGPGAWGVGLSGLGLSGLGASATGTDINDMKRGRPTQSFAGFVPTNAIDTGWPLNPEDRTGG